jgi:hypothetical protein
LIHVPDDAVPAAFSQFHRVLRAGAPLLLGFYAGDEFRLKTDGYGGHPMRVQLHFRPPARVTGWLREAGFTIEAELLIEPDVHAPAAIIIARR